MTKPKKIDFHIDPTDDDFGALCNCAVRYCFGRRSYMPKVIVDYITPLLPKLNDRTLECFKSDYNERQRSGFDFGNSIDYETWARFHLAVCNEIERRNPYKEALPNERHHD